MKKGSTAENKKILKEADYEKYQLVLPYRFLFGRKRQRFIYSELEKMHPCFSDEFCFDSNIRKFSRKGLVSDVLVIHKYTLAEYESKRGTGGDGYFVSGDKRHKFFRDGKMKRGALIGALVAGFILLFVLIGFFGDGVFGIQDAKPRNETSSVSESGEGAVAEEVVVQRFLIEDFLSGIKSLCGRMLFFRWESNADYESLDAKVKGAFPEDISGLGIDDLNMGAVNYEEGVPVIQVSVVSKSSLANIDASQTRKASALQNAWSGEFYQSNRNVLLSNGVSLKDEKMNPYTLHFVCDEKVLRTVVLGLAENCRGAGVVVSAVTVNVRDGAGIDGAGDVEMSISCSEGTALARGDGLAVVGENSDIFGEIKKSIPAQPLSKHATVKKSISNPQKSEMPDAQKIGEIKSSDGKVIRFYKTNEGKIKKVMEEQ